MSEIEEIPLESQEPTENTQDIPQDNQENPEEIQPAPKKRARPPGAKNRPKSAQAPKPKPKAKAKKEQEYEDYSEEDETPPPRRRGGVQEQPHELDRHALASEVLNILQQQRYNQTSARRNHYASWFANMQWYNKCHRRDEQLQTKRQQKELPRYDDRMSSGMSKRRRLPSFERKFSDTQLCGICRWSWIDCTKPA